MSSLEKYRQGPDGFIQFIDDFEPRIIDRNNKVIKFQLEPFQRDTINKLLAVDENGDFKYQTLIVSYPRRHSKSTIAMFITLWRFACWPNQTIKLIANSERQSKQTQYNRILETFRFSPKLNKWVGGLDSVRYDSIVMPRLNNHMEMLVAGTKFIHGEGVDFCWYTEMHESKNDSTYQIMASSMGDVHNSQILIDSTCDVINGSMHRLEELSNDDPDSSIAVSRLEYKSLDDALENSPAWISREWLKNRKKELYATEFASQHLNRRQQAENHLFAVQDLKKCKAKYKNGIDKVALENISAGQKLAIGGGLDRANPFSELGSNTVWTTVAKGKGQDGEPIYYVLHQDVILGSLGKGIKTAIDKDHDRYGLDNFVLENANVADLRTWAGDREYNYECLFPTYHVQEDMFFELYKAVKEHRIYIPSNLKNLFKEMEKFTYHPTAKGFSFGSGKVKNDRVYSLAWAVYSLRNRALANYELDTNIICKSRSGHSKFCYLRGGDMIIDCSDTCPAHQKVRDMYNMYRKQNPDSDISLPKFFKRYVVRTGVKIYKAV